MPPARWSSRLTRGSVLFVGGLIGVVHETLLRQVDRPTLLLLFAAMMGLPAFLPSRDQDPKP